MSHLGDIYDTPTESQFKVFEKPYDIIVEKDYVKDKWGSWLSCFTPIVDQNGQLECILGLDMSAKKIIDYENKNLLMIALITVVMCIISVIIGALISRRLTKPLLYLSNDLNEIQKLNLNNTLDFKSNITEIATMKNAIENMKKGLRSFKKYVPADLVTELISLNKEAVLDVEKREVTIFFSDIANFTTISEQVPPEILADNLGEYFALMTKILIDNKATVDKYIGDAIMAFWGAPKVLQSHPFDACKSALFCQRKLKILFETFKTRGFPEMNTRIGLELTQAKSL